MNLKKMSIGGIILLVAYLLMYKPELIRLRREILGISMAGGLEYILIMIGLIGFYIIVFLILYDVIPQIKVSFNTILT